MRKNNLLAMMLMISSVSLGTISCGSDGDDNPGGIGGDSGITAGGSSDAAALNSNQAKQKMEQYARELMNKINSNEFSNFQAITDVAKNTNDKAIEKWLDACLEACEIDGSTDDNLKRLYAASNFTGEFTLNKGVWSKSSAKVDYLKFSLTDKDGKACTLTVTTSGSKTTIHHEAFDDEEYEGYWDGQSHWTTIENSFVIPENINITLTQGSNSPLTAQVHTSISKGSGDFDYTRDNAEVSATVKVNDWQVLVNKAAFKAGKNAEATVKVIKGNETILEANANANGVTTEDGVTVNNANVIAKVLGGKVRIEGVLKEGFQNAINNADENDENETKFKQYITNANALMDVNLYFDDSKNQSAKLILIPYVEKFSSSYYSHEYWYSEPGLLFTDGTSYSFEQYFDESTFNSVIKQFENIVNSFTNMFGED